MRHLRRIIYLGLIITYISGVFIHEDLHILTSIFAATALIISIPYVRGVTLALTLLFLFAGSAILIGEGATLWDFFVHIRRMANIFTLVVLIRVLGFPLELGGYSDIIRGYVNRQISGEGLLYVATTVIAYLIGMSIIVASVPVVFYTIERAVKNVSKEPEKFLSMAIKRGLFLALLWTPSSPLMAVVLDASGASYGGVFFPVMTVSLLGLLLALVIYYPYPVLSFRSSKDDNCDSAHDSERECQLQTKPDENNFCERQELTSIINLGIILLSLIISLVVLDYLFDYGMLNIVIMVSLIFSFVWSTVIGQRRSYINKLTELIYKSLSGYHKQVCLFLSAGFFADAVGETGDVLSGFLLDVLGGIGSMGVLFLLPPLIILVAVGGVHPLIIITILGEALSPLVEAFPSTWLAFSLQLGGAIALLVSPFSAATLITADLVHRTPFKVGVVWNALFAVYMLLIGYLLLYFIGFV